TESLAGPRWATIHVICEWALGVAGRGAAAPAAPATRPCSSQASACTLLNQASLKLGQGRKDVEHELPGRRRGIDRAITQRAKPHLPLEGFVKLLRRRCSSGKRVPLPGPTRPLGGPLCPRYFCP